jgi:hypothetical protein
MIMMRKFDSASTGVGQNLVCRSGSSSPTIVRVAVYKFSFLNGVCTWTWKLGPYSGMYRCAHALMMLLTMRKGT